MCEIGFLDDDEGVFVLHDFVATVARQPSQSATPRRGGEELSESLDYSIIVEECDESDKDKEYARLIRNGYEITPVDIFGTDKSQDELLRESLE